MLVVSFVQARGTEKKNQVNRPVIDNAQLIVG